MKLVFLLPTSAIVIIGFYFGFFVRDVIQRQNKPRNKNSNKIRMTYDDQQYNDALERQQRDTLNNQKQKKSKLRIMK